MGPERSYQLTWGAVRKISTSRGLPGEPWRKVLGSGTSTYLEGTASEWFVGTQTRVTEVKWGQETCAQVH